MKNWIVFSLSLPVLLIGACQQQQQIQEQEAQKNESPKTPPPLHLGAVHQVYPEQQFALLRIIGPMPGPGTTLITHPPDGSTSRIGNLIISTGQPSRNNIIAADIRSGTVVKGDRVFRYRNISEPDSKEQEVPGEEIAEEIPTPHPAPDNNLSTQTDEDFPSPVLERSDEEDQDTIVESDAASTPAVTPSPLTPSTAAPAYLQDIPDDISQWD